MGIFADTKILELGSGAAGPLASRPFAEQGARVIRVESARRPDFLRALFRAPEEAGGLDASPMFVCLNADKESVTLDLSGYVVLADDVDALIERLDVLLTYGTLSAQTRDVIRSVLLEIEDNNFRARTAIYLFLISPDYAVRI